MRKTMRNIKLFENYNSSYTRIIPRDFFNESKLLKCMAFLSLAILDNKLPHGIEISIKESGEPFDIVLDIEHDMIVIDNYPVTINGDEYMIGTLHNSKENYPFYVIVDDEEIEVFDDNGKFTTEFIEKFQN